MTTADIRQQALDRICGKGYDDMAVENQGLLHDLNHERLKRAELAAALQRRDACSRDEAYIESCLREALDEEEVVVGVGDSIDWIPTEIRFSVGSRHWLARLRRVAWLDDGRQREWVVRYALEETG